MIGRLRGTLAERGAGRVIVDCGGVGYDVAVSAHTLLSLPPVGDTVTLRIYTQVGQDRIALYGFGSAEERELFDALITVKNVGPALAVVILSGSTPQAIAQMIVGEDLAGLTSIKGLGKKGAERIVVDLREKCEYMLTSWGAGAGSAPTVVVVPSVSRPKRDPRLDEVASALVNLGWKQPEADKIIEGLDLAPEMTVEQLLRDALRAMPR